LTLSMSSLARAWLGRLDEALELASQATTSGREVGHPLTLAYTLAATGIVYQLVGDVERVDATARELVSVAREHSLPMWLAWGRTLWGWSLLEAGDEAQGMAELTAGMAGAEVAR